MLNIFQIKSHEMMDMDAVGHSGSKCGRFYMNTTDMEPNDEELLKIMGFASFASYKDRDNADRDRAFHHADSKDDAAVRWRGRRCVDGDLRRVAGLALFRCKEGSGVESAEWLLLQSIHNTLAWSPPKVKTYNL